jgi:hypothetical protein
VGILGGDEEGKEQRTSGLIACRGSRGHAGGRARRRPAMKKEHRTGGTEPRTRGEVEVEPDSARGTMEANVSAEEEGRRRCRGIDRG